MQVSWSISNNVKHKYASIFCYNYIKLKDASIYRYNFSLLYLQEYLVYLIRFKLTVTQIQGFLIY